MALKPLHYGVVTAAACALIAAALLPPSNRTVFWVPPRKAPVLAERTRLLVEARRALLQWHSAVQRDSIRAEIARVNEPSAKMPLVLTQEQLSPRMRTAAGVLLAKRWSKLKIDSLRVPVAIAVLADTTKPDQRFDYQPIPGVEHLVPGPDDVAGVAGNGCLAVIRLGASSKSTRRLFEAMGQHSDNSHPGFGGLAFGPCAFFAAFGRPGPRIAAWLSARGYDFAKRAAWGGGSQELDEDVDWASWQLSDWLFSEGSDIQQTSLVGRRCKLGDFVACERTILEPLYVNTRGLAVADPSPVEVLRRTAWGKSDQLLSDIVREVGSERFQRFWTSPDDPAVAFEQAMGESLGSWTHRWVQRTYGRTVAGARIRAIVHVSGLTIAMFCVGLAAAVAGRRQVS